MAKIINWVYQGPISSERQFIDRSYRRVDRVLCQTEDCVLDDSMIEGHAEYPTLLSYPQNKSKGEDKSVCFVGHTFKPVKDVPTDLWHIDLRYSNQIGINDTNMLGGRFEFIIDPTERPAAIDQTCSQVPLMMRDAVTKFVKGEEDEKDATTKIETSAGEPIAVREIFDIGDYQVEKNVKKPRTDLVGLNAMNSDTFMVPGYGLYPPCGLIFCNCRHSRLQMANSHDKIFTYYVLSFMLLETGVSLDKTPRDDGKLRLLYNAKFLLKKGLYPTEKSIRRRNRGLWNVENVGYFYLAKKFRVGANGTKKILIGNPPAPPSTPVPLDRKGQPLLDGNGNPTLSKTEATHPNSADEVTTSLYQLWFETYPRIKFTGYIPVK